MAKSLNMVQLIGHLGADPETRYQANGAAVAEIRVATTDSWTDKQGQKQERTEWHRCVFHGRLAEVAGEYLSKGRQVYIKGELRTDKYTDREGIERYSTKIVVDDLQMLGAAPGKPASNRRTTGRAAANAAQNAMGNDEGDGDVPF